MSPHGGNRGPAGAAEGSPAYPSISAVLNTLNEEARVGNALASLRPWVDEIVVVDMLSDDRTAEIARSFGATVYPHERLGYADPARAFAIERTTGDWIMVLDADELVPASLARRLLEIALTDRADVVRIPMINYLFGAPLRATGWGPNQDSHLRFFRRGQVLVTGEIHNYLQPVEGARVLALPTGPETCLVHQNYVDVHHFVEKLNRYTEIEASHPRPSAPGPSYASAMREAAREFLRRYLRQRGYRDGWRGFYLAWLMAGYRLVTAAKRRQLRDAGSRDVIERAYALKAAQLLLEYEAFNRDDLP